MPNITLSVGGLKYTIACANNQEEALTKTALLLDEKVSAIKSKALVSEGLGLVMGSIMLIHELNEKIERLTEQKETSGLSPEVLSQTIQLVENATNKISSVAELIENA